ncbi:MAG TPA: glycosyltransferase family 87 protein, partial [Gemmata sp.]
MTYSGVAAWLRPKLWVGLVVGAVSWLVWVASLAIGGWYKDSEEQLVGADHLAFYHAAKLIREGRGHDIYSYLALNAEGYQQGIVGWAWGGENRAFEAYRNPPFYALLYVPTAGLSYYWSFVAWTAIGCALLGLAIRLLAPERPGRVFVWALAFFPVFAVTSFGQNTFISLAIFAGVYRLLSDERPWAAGTVAGLLWFKPQLLLGLFVWWALDPRRYWKCFLGTGATGAFLACVSWAVVPGASQAFVDTIRVNAGFSGFGMWNVVN